MLNLQAFKTSSLVKMKNLKFLGLDDVKLTGSFENFPILRWLKWRGCNLKIIPQGLLTSCLVALNMTCGDLEEFDPPVDLISLKVLNLNSAYQLVSICNLHRLPKLETLTLDHCISLTHVCKTIGDLENLYFLSLAGCTKLWKASSNQMFVNQQERLKGLYTYGGIPEQPLCSLPQSLDLLILTGMPFEILPSYIDLKMLRVLYLNSCPNLKSLLCLPSMLEELHVEWCTSLEIITFQSARFTLQEFDYEGCFKLCEIEGLFKLVSITKLDEAELGHLQWIKAYQDHEVHLVGDEITEGRTWNIQMLYEYGIRSTYLQGIKDQSMETHQYTSSSWFLSFCVPLHPQKRRIQGLNVTIIYRSLGEYTNTDAPPMFARIRNISKCVTWVYNPVVYCKPRVDEYAIWLSYWPIGNTLDVGDEVYVNILVVEGMIRVSGCGASLVYKDGGELEKEEEKSEEEVTGGDLSEFQVTKGGYYLCRKDFFNSIIPDCFFGDDIQISDSRRWRTQDDFSTVYEGLNTYRNPKRHVCIHICLYFCHHRDFPVKQIMLSMFNPVSKFLFIYRIIYYVTPRFLYLFDFSESSYFNGSYYPLLLDPVFFQKYKVELGVSFNSESQIDKIEKAVSNVEGVESVIIHKEVSRLIVCGRFDYQAVVTCVGQFEKMVQVLLPPQELKKDSLLLMKENGSEGIIDDASDDEFFDCTEALFDDESEV
ncbi:putative 17-beta-estradiol 17-dehydrogenase [Helianthus anomalus]